MDSLRLLKLFKFFGVSNFTYNRHKNSWKKRSNYLQYTILITITIQTFNVLSFCFRQHFIQQYFFKVSDMTATSKIILVFDGAFWVTLNSSIMFEIILKGNGFFRVLNERSQISKILSTDFQGMNKSDKDRFAFLAKSYILLVLIGIPTNVFVNYGNNFIAIFTFISHCFLISQFLFGHLYELMFVEKYFNKFWVLQSALRSSSEVRVVKLSIKMHSECLKLARRTMKLFRWSKVMCLVCVLVLNSIYLFFKHERLIKGSIKRQF